MDEIRYGGFEQHERTIAPLRGLNVHLNEKFKVAFCEDNQATIHIIQTGNSAQLRHADRTQRTSLAWLREQFTKGFFNLVNVNTVYQVADILTKPFTSKAKWDHACNLIGVLWVQLDGNITIKPAPTSEAQASAVSTHETYDRFLCEFCCSDDSKLGDKSRLPAFGCKVLRVTERQNALVADTLKWVFDEVQLFRKNVKSKTPPCVMLHASLPCTGGCPWNNINGQTQEGQAKIQEHKALFRKLLKRLDKLITMLRQLDIVLVINMELPKLCSYWKNYFVHDFLMKYEMVKYNCDGCMFGVLDKDGNLLQKSWTIASSCQSLAKLQQYNCTKDHQHGQSRGAALKRAESYTYQMTDLIHGCFSEFADSMKQVVTDSSAQRPTKRALVALKLPSPVAAMAAYNLGEYSEGNLEYWRGVMTSFTSNTLFQETRPEDRKTMEQILGAQATLQSSCAMWAADYAPELMDTLCAGRITLGATCGRNSVYLVVSDSSLALISGGKKNRKRADLAQDMNYNRSTSCSHCEVRMCWGKDLTFLTWTVKSAMKDLKKRPEFKDHNFYVTVYWSGNELVGSGGICDEPEWPYRCGDGHWPELFNKCAKAIDVLEECRSWRGIANITILANTEGSYYMLPPIYNQFMEKLLDESLNKHKLLRKKESTFLVSRQDRLDNYHMVDSIENRKTTVEWLWSLFNVMKCVAVVESHKEDFNNVRLYLEYSHDAEAGLNPYTLAEYEANRKLTLESWESLQRPIKLAKGRILEKIEEVKEEIDYDDDDALPQGSAAEAALGVKAAPATPKFTAKASPKVQAKASAAAVASDVRGATPAGSSLPGKPGGTVIFRGQEYEARILPGTILKVPNFMKGETSSTDRCTTISGMLRGRFQEQRPLDFDENYFVDVHQLCDKFNRKTRSNIGHKTLLKIFALDPKCRYTVLAIKHPSAAENNQEWVVIKVRASQGHASSVDADGDISRNQYALAKAIYGKFLPEDARKVGLQLSPIDDGPGKLYHCTSKNAAENIVRTGLIPGGVGVTESGRSQSHFSIHPVESSSYNAGVRATMPIELVIDFKYAIELGVVFFLSESDVMLTADIVPNDSILYYTDAKTGEVLWRNALRLEALENQTTLDTLAARRAVTVTADEAFQTDAEGNRATNPEEEQTNEDTAASRPGQPAADTSVVRFKTFAMPVHYTDCSLCGEDMMQGQLKCQRCGRSTKENNDVQLFRAAKRRTQMLEEVSHRVGKTVDQLLINDFKGYADVAKRGATSFEAKQIEASKNYDSRARKLGYDNVVDRFDKDATFALRMVEQGHNRDSLYQMSIYRFCVLPEFPRSYDQRLLGVGPRYGKRGLQYVRTVYVTGGKVGDYDASLLTFPWLFSYNGKMLSLHQFVDQVNILPGMRKLVTFGGKFPTLRATGAEDLEAEVTEICCQAEDDAKKLARRSQRQSAEDRARGPVQPAQPASSSAARSRSWRDWGSQDWSSQDWSSWQWSTWSSRGWSTSGRW